MQRLDLDHCCQDAFAQFCLEHKLDPKDDALRRLARLICDAVGAASLGDWLAPGSRKRALLAEIEERIGPLNSAQIALAEDLLSEHKSFEDIVALLTPEDVESHRRAKLAQAQLDDQDPQSDNVPGIERPRG